MSGVRVIDGRWWMHGKDKSAAFGTLTFDPSSELKVVVKNPIDRTVDQVLAESVAAQRAQLPPVIHGADKHGKPISLFACGMDSHSHSAGMEILNISAIAGLIGEHFPDWGSVKFLTSEVRFTLLDEWLGEQIFENSRTVDGRDAVVLRPSSEAWLYDLSNGEKLRFDREVSTHYSLSEFRWEMGHRAWFHFPSEQSLSTIIDDRITRVRQLLSLLIGSPVYIDGVFLFHSDPFLPAGKPADPIELLRPNRGLKHAPRDVPAFRMIAPFSEIEIIFQQILTRWLSVYRQLEPVIDLYFTVLFNKTLPVTTQFLLLAQALEAYHSRSGRFESAEIPTASHRKRVSTVVDCSPSEYSEWIKSALEHANSKTLAQRLSDILDLHANEANQLFSTIPEVATRIRYTRNYLTHYDEKIRNKIFNEQELSQVTFWMLPFLQICLLKELDITGAPISRILHRFGDVHFIDLDSKLQTTSPTSDKDKQSQI